MRPEITAFSDEATNTISYVVVDPSTKRCAVIDSVLDYDRDAARTDKRSANDVLLATWGHPRTGEEGERGTDLIATESPTISAMRRTRSTDQGRLCARGVSGYPLAPGYSRMKV